MHVVETLRSTVGCREKLREADAPLVEAISPPAFLELEFEGGVEICFAGTKPSVLLMLIERLSSPSSSI